MAVIQLPDELQHVIERQVAEGRATSLSAFLEEAVRRLVDETKGEEDDLFRVVEAGSADMQAGCYTTVATSEDERLVHEGILARLRANLSTGH